MKRRKVIKQLGLMTGAGLVLPAGIFSGCRQMDYEGKLLLQSEIALIDEIGETILPETEDSPGAKAANVGNFLDSYLSACVPESEQLRLRNGLESFSESCKKEKGKTFAQLSAAERHQHL
ncbi:MAG: gluconate 2-dehydrogenase subunit 3 family protein, partial [Bacteroidota bacterium]